MLFRGVLCEWCHSPIEEASGVWLHCDSREERCWTRARPTGDVPPLPRHSDPCPLCRGLRAPHALRPSETLGNLRAFYVCNDDGSRWTRGYANGHSE
jgi:hypothetical protein